MASSGFNVTPTSHVSAHIHSYRHPRSSTPFFLDLHVSLAAGAVHWLVGLSGVGKTTLLSILLDTAPGDLTAEISLVYKGESLRPHEAKRLGLVGVLPQEPSLLPWRSLRDNILLPSALNPRLRAPAGDQILSVLQSVGLGESVTSLLPHEASLGMAARVALARLLIYNPKFILLDEVFSTLDPATTDTVASVLSDYVSSNDAVCFAITHNIRHAIETNGDLYYLSPARALTRITSTDDTERIVIDRLHEDMNYISQLARG